MGAGASIFGIRWGILWGECRRVRRDRVLLSLMRVFLSLIYICRFCVNRFRVLGIRVRLERIIISCINWS